MTLIRPALVRRLVLASSAPRGARGMHGWGADVIDVVGAPVPTREGILDVFFTRTESGRQAGAIVLQRMRARAHDRVEPTSWQTRQTQYDAVCTWGIPRSADLERLAAIDMPVFVANGDSDPMIVPRYSHLLAELLPDARLRIYPAAAHGFLFQHHSAFAADVNEFLDT